MIVALLHNKINNKLLTINKKKMVVFGNHLKA